MQASQQYAELKDLHCSMAYGQSKLAWPVVSGQSKNKGLTPPGCRLDKRIEFASSNIGQYAELKDFHIAAWSMVNQN